MVSRQKTKVQGHCNPACTFQWEKQENEVFHVLVSKYLQSLLYLILFILMKAMRMPRHTLTPITTTKLHIVVTKMAKTLDFDDFHYF